MDGDPMKRDCVARYVRGGKTLAVAGLTIGHTKGVNTISSKGDSS